MANIGLYIAFTAGLVSFLSPCILPILPGFLAFLAGDSAATGAADTQEQAAPPKRLDTFINAVFFVLGFSAVFSLLGVLLNTLFSAFAYDALIWAGRIGGVIIIIFGLYLTGLLKIPFLDRDYKIHPTTRYSSRRLTSFVFGAAFAAGWTPCVGAVLGSILGLAATQPGSAFTLLMAYSLGLGLPFLLFGLFTDRAIAFLRRFRASLRYITVVFGVLLIGIGILAFTNQLGRVANFDTLFTLFN